MGKIFEWAGSYRTVDLSSGDIRWCHAKYIPNEMEKFSQLLQSLSPFTPELSKDELLHRLAGIHGELIAIHPFRDGNGRVTRLFCDLLLMQAEKEPFGQKPFEDETVRNEYFAAVKRVWSQKDYVELIRLFDRLLPAG